MIKTMFLVPIKDNDGVPFTPRYWRTLERKLIDQFGGYSLTVGVLGAWKHEGRVYHDESRFYEVAIASWRKIGQFIELIDWVRALFRQETVYVEIASVPEIIGRT